MNKKGFTLVELIAVLAVLALITLITFPNLKNLMKNNNAKEYQTIEDMMVEYAKVVPNYRSKSYICLKDLDYDISEKISSNLSCNGYVNVSGSDLIPYLSCSSNGSIVYKTTGYSLPASCGA